MRLARFVGTNGTRRAPRALGRFRNNGPLRWHPRIRAGVGRAIRILQFSQRQTAQIVLEAPHDAKTVEDRWRGSTSVRTIDSGRDAPFDPAADAVLVPTQAAA